MGERIEPPKDTPNGYTGTWRGKQYFWDPDARRGEPGYSEYPLYKEHKAAYERQQREDRERLAQEGRDHVFFDDCFVATSAFEGRDHPVVDALRQYRDEVMVHNTLGRAVHSAYYDLGLGKIGAQVLDRFPRAKPVVRAGLEKLVQLLSRT